MNGVKLGAHVITRPEEVDDLAMLRGRATRVLRDVARREGLVLDEQSILLESMNGGMGLEHPTVYPLNSRLARYSAFGYPPGEVPAAEELSDQT